MMKKEYLFGSLIFIFLFWLSYLYLLKTNYLHTNAYPDWKIVFKNDKQGNTIIGNRSNLIQAIRNGCDVKIAWGSQRNERSIEHISEPIWIAIHNETEVVAYVDAQVFIPKDKTDWQPKEWRVKITTGGAFDAIWLDRLTDTLTRHVPQQHTMAWMVRCTNAEEKVVSFFTNN